MERGQVRGYAVVPPALRDAFARVIADRSDEARVLKKSLGIAVEDTPRRRATRKASAKKRR